MRQIVHFPIENIAFEQKMLLSWAAQFEPAMILDSNHREEKWQCLIGVGALDVLIRPAGTAFRDLEQWQKQKNDWLFGYLAYDLKNEVERLASNHFDGLAWPDMVFFQPKIVIGMSEHRIEFHLLAGVDAAALWADIKAHIPVPKDSVLDKGIQLKPRMPKEEYLHKVQLIKKHIEEGDLYEMNLCQEFYADHVVIDPFETFKQLNTIAKPPFAVYFKWQKHHLLSASPERYLQKIGDMVISQPIKGTRRRGETEAEDTATREELARDLKERAEHVMIVDLVRNDLARHCEPGSVRVNELFGIHTFETVHQMISTVQGRLKDKEDVIPVLRDAFPPGSMTGAPKVMAMSLIEQYELTRRGMYAGAVGYFDPKGDFDFNVVIRSILYHETQQYLSASVGGAIVFDSDPEREYAECLVKLSAMAKALGAA
jgi:para-aminobenzoate synthetase component I